MATRPVSTQPQRDLRPIAVAAAGIAAFINVYAPQSLLPMLSDVFHCSHQAASLTIGATTLAIALTSPFAGALVSWIPRKKLMGLAMLGLSLATFLASTSADLSQLIFYRFVLGIFLPPVAAGMMGFIGEEWSGAAFSRKIANYVTWSVVGGFLGRFISGIAASHLGWRSALVLLAGINAVGGLVLVVCIPHQRSILKGKRAGRGLALLRKHLANPDLQAAFASGFNVLFSLVGLFTYLTFYLAAPPFNLGPSALGSVFFVYLIGVVVTPLSGILMGRIGFRNSLLLATTSVAVGAVLTLVPNLVVVMLGLALSSSGAFVSQASASGYVSQVGGASTHCDEDPAEREARRTSALGIYLSCYYFGGSCGAAVPGFFWRLGGWPACVALLLAVQAFNLVLVGARFKGNATAAEKRVG